MLSGNQIIGPLNIWNLLPSALFLRHPISRLFWCCVGCTFYSALCCTNWLPVIVGSHRKKAGQHLKYTSVRLWVNLGMFWSALPTLLHGSILRLFWFVSARIVFKAVSKCLGKVESGYNQQFSNDKIHGGTVYIFLWAILHQQMNKISGWKWHSQLFCHVLSSAAILHKKNRNTKKVAKTNQIIMHTKPKIDKLQSQFSCFYIE